MEQANCEIVGIGFDATCSLVLLDKDKKGVEIREESSDEIFDVILWESYSKKFNNCQITVSNSY